MWTARDPLGPTPGASFADVHALIRAHLREVASALAERDVPAPEPEGKLIRPVVAYAMTPPDRRPELDDRFWFGALAIQMVHDASLLHDDILDGASERRGLPTVNHTAGVGPALALGDHYLTGAYRAALATGSAEFLRRFIVAVERTVAGEIRQASHVGSKVDLATYFEAILGKSGELLGAAACLGGALLEAEDLDERAALGRQMGALYQQVDDLLDYCAGAATGKEPLKDYRQRKWTWVLEIAGVESFDLSDGELLEVVFGTEAHGISAAERAVRALEIRADILLRRIRKLRLDASLIEQLLNGWLDQARLGVEAQLAQRSSIAAPAPAPDIATAALRREARALGGPEDWPVYFGRHARTFSLAAKLFPPADAMRISTLYAFCRFTDDLVDLPAANQSLARTRARLAAWGELARSAFEGQATRIPVLDQVMDDARGAGVPWTYPEALLRGAEMDLNGRRYRTWSELEVYTFCVAGSVGGWMTHLFGLRDPELLDRAHALGHAMQLTNILRDVGEDLERGRIYLPEVMLTKYGLSPAILRRARCEGAPLPELWPEAMEELMRRADEHYARARPGLRALPASLRRPAAVAAAAYRGIHGEVRRNGYDNLRLRAHTSLARKLGLGVLGLLGTEPFTSTQRITGATP